MNNNSKKTNRAVEYLDDLLHDAFEVGADTIEFERVPGGLEVCILRAGTGLGRVLKDPKFESELIELIVERAGLEERVHGKLKWKINGQDCVIAVEEYDSFGESCFRLTLGKPRSQRKK